MEKRLNEVDKTNRKLDEQRIKTSAENTALKSSLDTLQTRFTDIDSQNRNYTSTNQELSSTLEAARCELAELRVRCEALVDNEAVTQNVSSALDEFRSAYQQMDKTQLKETREQLDSVRKDNEILSNFVKVIY
jgi:archaellum component FlaC